jgi:hypothetical protein
MDERGEYHRRYMVNVQSDATGARIGFRFTDSIHNEELGKIGLDHDELLYAFRCFVEDAIAGDQSFSEFASDFGYDADSYSARQIHEACQAAARKYERLWDKDPYDVINELAAEGIE